MRTIITLLLALFLAGPAAAADKKEPAEKPDAAADINKPGADARKITVDATEGTWMSVDLSPDGTTLIFDLLGDIFTMPVAGGEAKALTSGPGYDLQPRYSPDGKTIAFGSDRGGMENVWLMDADGKNPRILSEDKDNYLRSAAWTPDGNYLILRKEDGKRAGIPPVELWMYHVRGGSGIKLTSKDEINNASGPVVSPDGRYIYFSARPQRFNYTPDISNGLWQIMRYDRETAETSQLTGGYGGAARPAISPDGKTLVYVGRRDKDTDLIERNLSTGAEHILVSGVSRDEQEGFTQMDIWPHYTFTRDGKSLIYTSKGKFHKLDLQDRQVTDIPFHATVEQYAAPRVAWQEKMDMGPVNAKILRWPSQSPDGRVIVFSAFGRIWLQDVAGGKASGPARRLTADDPALPKREYSPAFSADGKWIAYVTWSDSEGGHIWKAALPAAGTATPQKLTKAAGHYINPTWSPAGDKLVVIQGSGLEFRGRQPEEENNFEIRILPSEGGEPQLVSSITIPATFRFHPEAYFNHDGTRIFFRDTLPPKPYEEQKSDLVSVRLDGTDRKRHLRFPSVGDMVPSPDEQWVLFTSRDNVYVTALPSIILKEPPEVGPKEGAVPVWRLSDEAGGYAGWADAGKTITWSLGNQFHRLSLDSAMKFAEEQKRKASAKKDDDAAKDSKKNKTPKKEEEPRVPKSESIVILVSEPRSIPSGSVLFRSARVVTMKGDEVLENADVLVTNNRIAAVGPAGSVKAPPDAKVMDAAGKTIIPGLIDTHAHLHYSGFELHPDNKWEYITNLAYGVTTTYDPSAPSLDVFAQAEMVEAGMMTGPRIYSSGDVLYGGQPFDYYAEVTSQDDAVRQVQRMKAYGARMIKVYQQPRRDQRIWFAEACRREHMLLTAEGGGELDTDMTMVLDGYTAWEHALPVELKKDVVEFVAKSQTFYTPTLLVAYGGPWGELYFRQFMNPHDDPKLNRFVPHFSLDPLGRRGPWFLPEEYHFPTVARGAAEVLRAGGNVALGAHGQQQGLGVHWELWAMAGEGQPVGMKAMTPLEAVRTATILAADKLGFTPDLGSVEAGKLADFVVLDANPLDDIHNTVKIHWVVKNGEVYDAETMREEWPQQRDLPPFFWSKQN